MTKGSKMGNMDIVIEGINEPTYSLTALARNRINLNGRPRNLETIKRKVIEYAINPVGVGYKNAPMYKLSDIEKVFEDSDNESGKGKGSGGNSRRALVEEKLKEQIERLKQDQVIKDLEIKERSKELISTENVKEFLQFRFEVENALLRRILFINGPIDIPGLGMAEARQKFEDYYNALQEGMRETLLLYGVNETEQIIGDKLKKIVDTLKNELERKQDVGTSC